ncbi:YbhQ family protein, partial [Escherichia coli]|uniref:YbhQ family protein n=1 Tax=Escherichia coli TaxID=562 RepID=UPI002021F742
MKWQPRVRVATGLSCWQIMLHLMVVALLVVGWMSKHRGHVGVGVCALGWDAGGMRGVLMG